MADSSTCFSDCWVGSYASRNHFHRLFTLSLNKEADVADLKGEQVGIVGGISGGLEIYSSENWKFYSRFYRN